MAIPGNGVSGVNGDALIGSNQICEVKKWSWKPAIESKSYASNKTGGAKKRISSVKDGSGTIEGVWDPWNPVTAVMDVGTELTLKLQHYSGQFWSVPAMINSLSFDVDIDSGEVESWTADFASSGPWTNPTALTSTTTTTAAPLMAGFDAAEPLDVENAAIGPRVGLQVPQAVAGQDWEKAGQRAGGSPRMAPVRNTAAPLMTPAGPQVSGLNALGANDIAAIAEAVAMILQKRGIIPANETPIGSAS